MVCSGQVIQYVFFFSDERGPKDNFFWSSHHQKILLPIHIIVIVITGGIY